MKPKRTWFENLQVGTGKKISRAFFLTYLTPSQVTKEQYPDAWNSRKIKTKKGFVMPIVKKYLDVWKEKEFIDTSRVKIPYKVERKKGKSYSLSSFGYLLNLEPLYIICKWDKNVEFTDDEKDYLNFLLLSENVREGILKEFPDEDIVSATMKYYVKNFILRYDFLLRDLRENPKRYSWAEKKSEELNNPTTKEGKMMKRVSQRLLKQIHRKYGGNERERKMEFDTLQVIASSNPKTTSDFTFIHYLQQVENKYEIVISTDRKILKALGVYPFDIPYLKDYVKESSRKEYIAT